MARLRVYLADLTHTGKGVATEAFPLNIGLVASYARKLYGNDIDVSLFKLPSELQEAIADRTPHVLACSNYTWNCNLSYYFCELVKSIDPHVLTVFGGTNYPFTEAVQKHFLESHPAVDIHTFYEGEVAFANILERALSKLGNGGLGDEPIAGCQFIAPQSSQFVNGGAVSRIKDLDGIPSPYATGLLDKFFDGQLTPLVETARGCPFLCNFCNAGDLYFNKVNLFSNDYVRDELTYIAKKASQSGITHMTLADNNFGMIPRDATTAQVVYELQKSFGWPRSMSAWTGKNSKERVIEVTRLLKDTLSISMSVQSMDEQVLENIGRDNIKLDHYRNIAQELKLQGRPQHAEVILPLPGESLESHIRGLNDLLDTGVSRVLSHTLQMLYGTPYKDDLNYRTKHQFLTKYRVVPLDFTKIGDEFIFDVEEVAVASDTLSFDDYVRARKYLLVIDLCHNSEVFEPLKKYLDSRGVRNSEWIQWIYDRYADLSKDVDAVFDSFEKETISELWDSEKDLVGFYSKQENYEKLVNYEAGGNVLFKHRVWMLSAACRDWVRVVFACTRRLLDEKLPSANKDSISSELANIEDYIVCSSVDCCSAASLDQTLVRPFDYDIPAWLASSAGDSLANFIASPPVLLTFSFGDRAIAVMRDAFRRYDTGLAGLVKLIQRISGVSFKRIVRYHESAPEPPGDIGKTAMHGPGWSSL